MRPSQVLAEVRKLYRRPSAAERTLKVLNPLPKDYQQKRGGRVPKRSLTGVYHGAIISTGTNVNTNNKDHTVYSTRTFKPNIRKLVHRSDVLNADFKMQTSMKALKEIRRHGGFDNYLLNAPPSLLSTETTRLRDAIRSSLHAYLDINRLLASSHEDGESALGEPNVPAVPELPRGITSRPHALDRVRPKGLQAGDEVKRLARERDGIVERFPRSEGLGLAEVERA